MEGLYRIFSYGFFQNAFFASILASISCGIIGTYIVSRRIVFVGGGITHASFGGIGIGYFIGINPIIGALFFSVLSALGIEYFTKKADLRNDSVIAMLWSLGMAIGIIFLYLSPGYTPNLTTFLFGSIMTIDVIDMFILLGLSAFLIMFFAVFYRLILFVSFDEQFAQTRKAPVTFINYLMISLVALTVVLNIKIAGIILIMALLTIPQNAVNLFTRQFNKMIYYSILIGFIGSFSGLIISYFMNIPSGATIIFSLFVIYIFLLLYRSFLIRLKRSTKFLK